MTDNNELHWNLEERHKMDHENEPTKNELTGERGDIIEADDGEKYRVCGDGSIKKL